MASELLQADELRDLAALDARVSTSSVRGGDQLREILVRRDHEGLEIAVRLGAFQANGSDEVVGLEAVDDENGNGEGAGRGL